MRPRRSCLTVPATSERMLANAAGLAADMVLIDLEDSVPDASRRMAAQVSARRRAAEMTRR